MKITIDEKNKATIAVGWYNGKRIKSVCVCKENDIFDKSFGTALAKKKWKQRKTNVQIKEIDRIIRLIEKILINMKQRRQYLCDKALREADNIYNFCDEHFSKLENN